MIITNPPYLALNSAKRRGIYAPMAAYFEAFPYYQDIYLIALERCLAHNRYVVAIIPETFLKSNFRHKERLVSVSVLEDNPFEDTDTPVCVVCFDGQTKASSAIDIYKNAERVMNLAEFEALLPHAGGHHHITFNARDGQLALRAIDSTDDDVRIGFLDPLVFKYDLDRIKHSSRAMTMLRVERLGEQKIDVAILAARANALVEAYRQRTCDLTLTPFKGNTRGGVRRRRLDYLLARMLLEQALDSFTPIVPSVSRAATAS